jgi:hypothetical protein
VDDFGPPAEAGVSTKRLIRQILPAASGDSWRLPEELIARAQGHRAITSKSPFGAIMRLANVFREPSNFQKKSVAFIR